MPTRKKRVAPWLTLSVAQGNAIQLGGLLVATALAWYAGRAGSGVEGERGARRMAVASRLLRTSVSTPSPTGSSGEL